MSQSFNFTKAMKELEEINQWFQREDIDLEEGLLKLRQGKELIEKCQARLDQVENEFQEIKVGLDSPATTEDPEVQLGSDLPF